MAALTLVTAPLVEPLTREDVKRQARIAPADADDDDLLDTYCAAAREACEVYTGRQLITATWQLTLDHWPSSPFRVDPFSWHHRRIELPRSPLQAVIGITYLDANSTEQTWDPSNYVVTRPVGPTAGRGSIALAYTKYWPPVLWQPDVITVTFRAGYGDSVAAVPPMLLHGMRLWLAEAYAVREDAMDVPVRARRCWDPFVSRGETPPVL